MTPLLLLRGCWSMVSIVRYALEAASCRLLMTPLKGPLDTRHLMCTPRFYAHLVIFLPTKPTNVSFRPTLPGFWRSQSYPWIKTVVRDFQDPIRSSLALPHPYQSLLRFPALANLDANASIVRSVYQGHCSPLREKLFPRRRTTKAWKPQPNQPRRHCINITTFRSTTYAPP